jgi:hypothetical protein
MEQKMNTINIGEFHGIYVQEYVVMVPVYRYGEMEEEAHGLAEGDGRLVGSPYADAVALAERLGGRVVEFGPMREIGE